MTALSRPSRILPAPSPPGDPDSTLRCPWYPFATPNKHSVARHPTWHLAYDYHCPICLHFHHKKPLLVQHLSRPSNSCLAILIGVYHLPLTRSQILDHAVSDKRRNSNQHERHPRLQHTFRRHGPLPAPNRHHRDSTHLFSVDGPRPPTSPRLPNANRRLAQTPSSHAHHSPDRWLRLCLATQGPNITPSFVTQHPTSAAFGPPSAT